MQMCGTAGFGRRKNGSDAGVELGDETEYDDRRDPDEAEYDGDAVEVALRDARGTEVRGDAAAEHVRQAAAATAVKQDQQSEKQAGDPQDDLEHYPENVHDGKTFREKRHDTTSLRQYK
jgi:hypothetical protein